MLSQEEAQVINQTMNQLISCMQIIQASAGLLESKPRPTKEDFDTFLNALSTLQIPNSYYLSYAVDQIPTFTSITTGGTALVDLTRARYLEFKY